MKRLIPLLLVSLSGGAFAQDVQVKVMALFTDKAMLQVNGQTKVVKKGETFEGVLLKSASGRGAVVVINGETRKLDLNQSISGNYKKRDLSKLKIYPDSLGMYEVTGKINGQSTRFLVDTGATFVTLSGAKAQRLKIDYRKGTLGQAQTAASVVNVYQIQLDSVSIGGIEVRNVAATVIPGNQPPEVLLGNSFLRHTRMQQAGSALEIEKRF